jgi:hypothetical protein
VTPFWVTFADRQSACIEAADEGSARQLARCLTGREATAVHVLPYPADPRLTQSETPSLCFQPTRCIGRTSCPRRTSCSD